MSGRAWMLTVLNLTLRLSVRSVSNRRVRSALVAYWTRPDSAAQRPVICSSTSGLSVRSHESVGCNGYLVLNWTRGGLGVTGCVRSTYRTRPVFTNGASGAAFGAASGRRVVSPIFEPTALFRGGFYLKPHDRLKLSLLVICIDIATL